MECTCTCLLVMWYSSYFNAITNLLQVEIAQRNNQLSLLTDVSELPLYGMMKVLLTVSYVFLVT